MKKLLFLLNAVIFINTYSIDYYNYNITTQSYKPVGMLISDTYQKNYDGLSFNFTTGNPFEIRFDQNSTADYINPVYQAFRNFKFTGNDKSNPNTIKLKGVGGTRLLYTQRIDLENVKLQPDQLELIMSGDNGNSYLNMKNSELNMSFGKFLIKAGDTFNLTSAQGNNIISGWQYTSQSAVNIDINPNCELKFYYGSLDMREKSNINIDHGRLIISGDTSEFLMKNSGSQVNLNFGEIKVLNSDVNVELQNVNSDWGKIFVDGNNAKLKLLGTTTLNDSSITLERGTIDIDNANLTNTGILIKDNTEFKIAGGSSNGTLVIDNTKGGTFETTIFNVNGGHFIYKGGNDSANSHFGTTKINNGILEFNRDSHLGGNLILNNGYLKFDQNILYGSLKGNGGTISGSVDVIGYGILGADLSGSTYQTNLKSKEVEDLANNRYKADKIYSDSFINNMNNIVVEGDSINAKDYENKKFTVANAPTITGSKNIVHGSTLPALVDFDVIDDSSVNDQDLTLVGKLKPTSSLANHSSITTNNSGGSQSNAQQVVNILPPSTINGNQPPLSSGAQKLQNALLTMTNAQVSQNLNSLHAEPYSSHLTVGLEQNDLFLNMIMDRSLPKGKAYTGHIEEVSLQNNMWFDIGYKEGKVRSEDELGNFKYSLTNVVLGGDLYEEDQLILGAYGGYGKHKMREHDMVTQDFETDSYHLGGYGSYIYKDLIFTGVFGYAYGNNQSERDVVVGSESGTSKDRFDSHSIYTGIRGAYPIEIASKTILTPNAGLSYSYLYQEEVVESGFDMADLKVDSTSADSFVSSVGLNLTYDGVINSTPVRPMTFVRYEHDWSAAKDSTHDVRAGFVHTPDSMTTFTGQNRGKNLVLVGIGVEVEITPTFLVGVELSYSDDTNGEETGAGFNFEYLW